MAKVTLQTKMRLRAFLLQTSEQPAPLLHCGLWVRLTRYYLTLLAAGWPAASQEDLVLAEAIVSRWEAP